MYIGLKNHAIVAFSQKLEDLKINAIIKNLVFDAIEETEEEILPYYNTHNDGIYFKKSQVPSAPKEIFNEQARTMRRDLYSLHSDPITNNISVLRDRLLYDVFADDDERQALEHEIIQLHNTRMEIRRKIIEDYPLDK